MVEEAIPDGKELLAAAHQSLVNSGFDVHSSDDSTRPAIVAHHPEFGIVALDLGSTEAWTALNNKVAILREEIPAIRRTLITSKLIDPISENSSKRIISGSDAASGVWLDQLPQRLLDEPVREDIRRAYLPLPEIEIPMRADFSDPDSDYRASPYLPDLSEPRGH